MNEIDLTTAEGLSTAAKRYLKDPDLKWLMIPTFGPIIYLGKKAVNYFQEKLPDSQKVINAQKETAEAIIRAGKEQGASKMKIKMSQKAGVDLGGNLEGYNAKLEIGNSGDMTIEIEYK